MRKPKGAYFSIVFTVLLLGVCGGAVLTVVGAPFTLAANYTTGGDFPISVVTLDVNGDGKIAFVLRSQVGSISGRKI